MMKNNLKWLLIIMTIFLVSSRTAIAQWVSTNGPEGGDVVAFAVYEGNIFAGTNGSGVFLSGNGGASWTAVNTGMTEKIVITSFAMSATYIYAGIACEGIYRSANNGTSWAKVNNGLSNDCVNALAVSGTAIFAGTEGGGIYLSSDNGASWTEVNNGLENPYVNALAVSGNTVFAGTRDGVFLSTNNGSSWSKTTGAGLTDTRVTVIAVNGSKIFAGTNGSGVFLSTDNGASWAAINTGLSNKNINALAASGGTVFAGTRGGLFLTADNGASWTAAAAAGALSASMPVFALAVSGSTIFAGIHAGVIHSTNNRTSWIAAADTGLVNTHVNALAAIGGRIFAGTDYYGLFFSTNSGASWATVPGANPSSWDQNVTALTVIGSNVLEGAYYNAFLSKDSGVSWDGIGNFTGKITNLAVIGPVVLVCVEGNGVYRSMDGEPFYNGYIPESVNDLAVSGAFAFAASYGGVYRSKDSGWTWTAVNTGLADRYVNVLAVSGNTIFAGTEAGGVYLSTNKGASWSKTGLQDKSVTALTISGKYICAATRDSGIFLSTNDGASWAGFNTGLATRRVNSLAIGGGTVFAGTSAGVWRRPLSEIVSVLPQNQRTATLQTRLRIAVSGSLHSGVMLNYSVQSRCIVQLGIYTISGKLVALLERGERAPGEYAVKVENGEIPSGLYVCRFQAGSYQESNRLMVMK
jgi:hypothetical protein